MLATAQIVMTVNPFPDFSYYWWMSCVLGVQETVSCDAFYHRGRVVSSSVFGCCEIVEQFKGDFCI